MALNLDQLLQLGLQLGENAAGGYLGQPVGLGDYQTMINNLASLSPEYKQAFAQILGQVNPLLSEYLQQGSPYLSKVLAQSNANVAQQYNNEREQLAQELASKGFGAGQATGGTIAGAEGELARGQADTSAQDFLNGLLQNEQERFQAANTAMQEANQVNPATLRPPTINPNLQGPLAGLFNNLGTTSNIAGTVGAVGSLAKSIAGLFGGGSGGVLGSGIGLGTDLPLGAGTGGGLLGALGSIGSDIGSGLGSLGSAIGGLATNPVTLPIAAALGVGALLKKFVFKGADPNQVPMANIRQTFDAAGDDIRHAAMQGLISPTDEKSLLNELSNQGVSEAQSALAKYPNANSNMKQTGTDIQNDLANILNAPLNPIASQPFSLEKAQSYYINPNTQGWYSDAVTGGNQLADQLLQSLQTKNPPTTPTTAPTTTTTPTNPFAGLLQ